MVAEGGGDHTRGRVWLVHITDRNIPAAHSMVLPGDFRVGFGDTYLMVPRAPSAWLVHITACNIPAAHSIALPGQGGLGMFFVFFCIFCDFGLSEPRVGLGGT